MENRILLFLVGVMMIVVALMRHARRKAKKMERMNKVRVKRPGKDAEFGKNVKWSIGDDD